MDPSEEPRSKIIRSEGESRGTIVRDVRIPRDVREQDGSMVDSIDEVEWIQEKTEIRERKSPMIRIEGGNRKKGFLACEIQAMTGGHFMWEDEMRSSDALMIKKMKEIDAGQVRIGERRIWTISRLVIDKVREEKERRTWRRSRQRQRKRRYLLCYRR